MLPISVPITPQKTKIMSQNMCQEENPLYIYKKKPFPVTGRSRVYEAAVGVELGTVDIEDEETTVATAGAKVLMR
jgi:hypothetical protein